MAVMVPLSGLYRCVHVSITKPMMLNDVAGSITFSMASADYVLRVKLI